MKASFEKYFENMFDYKKILDQIFKITFKNKMLVIRKRELPNKSLIKEQFDELLSTECKSQRYVRVSKTANQNLICIRLRAMNKAIFYFQLLK